MHREGTRFIILIRDIVILFSYVLIVYSVKTYPSRRAQESFYGRTDQPSSTAGSSLLYRYTISTINQPRLCIWSKLGSSFNQSINFNEVIERTLYALCIHSNQALFSTKPMVCIPSTLLSYPWQQLKILGAVSC